MTSSETIFFSYSRANSEFVLDLAKNLRNAGANIWLDQLDIAPGTRWDSSIEEALKSSKTLLVILSKDAVASQNVMDEVSYALGENKQVVPVLFEDCEIPFRLKRLQYADFTSDHKQGLNTLAKALDLDQKVTSKLADSASESSAGPQTKMEEPKDSNQDTATKVPKPLRVEPKGTREKASPDSNIASRSKNKMPMFLGGSIMVLLAILWMSGVFTSGAQIDSPNDFEKPTEIQPEEPSGGDLPLNEAGEKPTMNDGATGPGEASGFVPQDTLVGVQPIQINGQNVTMVQYTDGQQDPAGYFRYVSEGVWEEESIIHGHRTSFEELGRDEWSVYLVDRARENLTIQLDLNTGKVNINFDAPEIGTLYNITGAESAR